MNPRDQNSAEKKPVLRHYAFVMAFAVVGTLLIVFSTHFTQHESYQAELSNLSSTTSPTASSTQGLARSLPVHLRIPAIHVDTSFEAPLGLNADKTIEAPHSFDDVGWYKFGATPGEIGPAVILGHVDTYKGPAVFYSLGQLKAGDEIYIDREDGSTATFLVTELHRYPQSDFPTQLVYGQVPYPALRLITCTGVYDHGVQRYDHNLVVYATLKESSSSTVVTDIK